MAKFIDLFAGLGGFHVALSNLGHECVWACEKNESLANLYEENYGLKPWRDIRTAASHEIPKFDILCAGFPCQPFSKAGNQNGLQDENNGNLFDEIVRILESHTPDYFILENVPFIAKHDNENTWRYIQATLQDLGYKIDQQILSPSDFNIPQHRKRIFIIGTRGEFPEFRWPYSLKLERDTISDFLSKDVSAEFALPPERVKCINIWQEFLDAIPKNVPVPKFPIWAMEFDATYPFEKGTPFSVPVHELAETKGSFGKSLTGIKRRKTIYPDLPSYARQPVRRFPAWKVKYIKQNREFFQKYREELAPVMEKLSAYTSQSWQKLEWNAKSSSRKISNYIFQFRASGIRVKEPNVFPSLVCTRTQVPIIGWEMRYITREEGARLQSLGGIKLPENETTCFKALGNAVNARLVELIAKTLIPPPQKRKTNRNSYFIPSDSSNNYSMIAWA